MLSEVLTDPLVNDGHTEYTPGISQSSAGGQLYYTQDRMGSDVQQENALGGITFSGQLDAFGNSITHTGNAVGLFGFAGSYGYQGDADIYCYLCGNREYDPSIGRFLTRDPAQDGGNWYDYCSNNPLSYVDPSGNAKVLEGWRYVLGGGYHGFLIIVDNDLKSKTYGTVWLVQLILEGKDVYRIEITKYDSRSESKSQRLNHALKHAGVRKGEDPNLVQLENNNTSADHTVGAAYDFANYENSHPGIYGLLVNNCNNALATLEVILGLYDKGWKGYQTLPDVWAPGFGHPWNYPVHTGANG